MDSSCTTGAKLMNYNIFTYDYKTQHLGFDKWGVREDLVNKMSKGFDKLDDEELDSDNNTALIAFVCNDGRYEVGENTACHATLNEFTGKKGDLKYIQNFTLTPFPDYSREMHLMYISWLINNSPYAEVFLNKDPEFILDNYYICDAAAPTNVLIGGLICTRFTWEDKNRNALPVWARIVKLGGDPNLAFAFSHIFRKTIASRTELYPIAATTGQDYHNLMTFSNAPLYKVVNFVKDNKQHIEEPFNIKREYNRVENLWEGAGNITPTFYDSCAYLQPISNKETVNYNIFKTSTNVKKLYEISNDEDLMNIFNQLEEAIL